MQSVLTLCSPGVGGHSRTDRERHSVQQQVTKERPWDKQNHCGLRSVGLAYIRWVDGSHQDDSGSFGPLAIKPYAAPSRSAQEGPIGTIGSGRGGIHIPVDNDN